MLKDNVLTFPDSVAGRTEPSEPAGRTPEQLDLFSRSYGRSVAIAFFNLESIDQNVLLSSLIKHSIKTIIDLRSRPIFPRPQFDHKYIMSYFYHCSINYIECAMSQSPSFELRPLDYPKDHDRLDHWVSADISPGVTACIVDEAAIESGTVAAFRYYIARRTTNLIEVHPRSLM